MTNVQELKANGALTLNAESAADLMTPNPLSIRQNATVKEAAAFLTDRGISAAPVIDNAGRAVGVLSRADIVVHHRQEAQFVPEFSTTMSGQTWPPVTMSPLQRAFKWRMSIPVRSVIS